MYTLCSLELPALEPDAFVVVSNIDKKMSTDGETRRSILPLQCRHEHEMRMRSRRTQ